MNVVLVLRTGGDFKITDVNLIVHHLKKTWKKDEPLNIYCLHNGIENTVYLTHFDLVPLPKPHFPGWWAKLHLFNPELASLRPFIFLDLDTALLNDGLTNILPEKYINSFITLEDFYRKNKIQSAFMYFPKENEKIDKVWNSWKKNTYDHINNFRGDQNFIESVVSADVFWQDIVGEKISSFKPKSAQWLVDPPNNLDVVCFHGYPRIPQAAKNNVKWVVKYISEYEQT